MLVSKYMIPCCIDQLSVKTKIFTACNQRANNLVDNDFPRIKLPIVKLNDALSFCFGAIRT